MSALLFPDLASKVLPRVFGWVLSGFSDSLVWIFGWFGFSRIFGWLVWIFGFVWLGLVE